MREKTPFGRWGTALLALLALLALGGAARADGERPGAFDHYVLALSWTPAWCALEGDARGAAECDAGTGRGFTLHGLWPQDGGGWPAYCPTAERAPSRARTAEEADLYGSSGLAWHQWRKHGTCTGLSADEYYRLAREAHARVERPAVLEALERAVTLPAAVVEEAFLEANPDFPADGVTVLCREGRIREVRLCLTRGLDPRSCEGRARRDCTLGDALLEPAR
ncbi:ribonuclease T2 [Jannaschia sp. W003]|uniref:ribonuclease T2 n=1 Tax=Jannaschia sp. W003 TaxID=2867012 RepID=UPI0021A63DBA|nr:ribonuclease T2 [Jannaschia sp. W003]UWQ22735.1 ribonuclease T2 [Jannaschia sp. W003]